MTQRPAPAALNVADRALTFADGPAQVLVTHERWLVSRFARSAPTQATDVDDLVVSVTAWHDGHTATATTNRSGDDDLRDTAHRAAAAARAARAAAGVAGDHPGLPDPAPVTFTARGFDPATAEIDPKTAGGALRTTFGVCAEHGLEAFGIWTAGEVATALASTTGIRLSETVTDAHLKVVARDSTGRSGWATGTAVGVGALDAAAIASRAAGKVLSGPAAELPPGNYPVVLEAQAVGALLDYLGSMAFNGLTHVEGRGALSGRIGSRVAAAGINLSDSPRFAGTLPRSFDFEGVPKAPVPLIQDGIAHNVVHDMRSAARAGDGTRSTGHGLPPDEAAGGPAPTNLVLIGGGAADEAELATPIERGIYVTRLWYLNAVRERDTLLTGTTRDGTFLIEDGKVTRPLRDVRFTDSVLRLLEHTEALTAGTELVSEVELYGRRFATGVVCPSLRASGFRVTGVTPA